MVKENIDSRPNNRPDDDIGDCPAVSPEGWLCTRNRNHTGNHDAQGVGSRSFRVWSDKAPYYPERGADMEYPDKD